MKETTIDLLLNIGILVLIGFILIRIVQIIYIFFKKNERKVFLSKNSERTFFFILNFIQIFFMLRYLDIYNTNFQIESQIIIIIISLFISFLILIHTLDNKRKVFDKKEIDGEIIYVKKYVHVNGISNLMGVIYLYLIFFLFVIIKMYYL